MRKLLYLFLLLCFCSETWAQFTVSNYHEGWDNIPPKAQKKGFSFQKSILVQMDNDPALEEVMLFGKDLGHYPNFDLFETYYAIVDNYTKEVEYLQDNVFVTDKFDLTVEDRNNDGTSELYRKYFKDNKYSTDEKGYHLKVTRCYDMVEWQPANKNFNTKSK